MGSKAACRGQGQGHGHWPSRSRPAIKNKLKFKFKSTYFQCHNDHILFSVLTISGHSITVRDGCYISTIQAGKKFFPSLVRLGSIVKPGCLKTLSTGADMPETGRKLSLAVAAVSGLHFQPSVATTDYWLLMMTPSCFSVSSMRT